MDICIGINFTSILIKLYSLVIRYTCSNGFSCLYKKHLELFAASLYYFWLLDARLDDISIMLGC